MKTRWRYVHVSIVVLQIASRAEQSYNWSMSIFLSTGAKWQFCMSGKASTSSMRRGEDKDGPGGVFQQGEDSSEQAEVSFCRKISGRARRSSRAQYKLVGTSRDHPE